MTSVTGESVPYRLSYSACCWEMPIGGVFTKVLYHNIAHLAPCRVFRGTHRGYGRFVLEAGHRMPIVGSIHSADDVTYAKGLGRSGIILAKFKKIIPCQPISHAVFTPSRPSQQSQYQNESLHSVSMSQPLTYSQGEAA